MLPELYVLDIIGTFSFSLFGAYVGIRRRFDVFGIFVVSFLTALGGGTLRELILGNVPFYFFDGLYVLVVLAGCFAAIVIYPVFNRIRRAVLVVDAIGLSTFAFIGASEAARAGLGFLGIIFLTTLSAVGGGLLRDIAIQRTPQIFYRDFYASPAIVLGMFYAALGGLVHEPIIALGLILCTFALRLVAVVARFNLWVPWNKTVEVKNLRWRSGK